MNISLAAAESLCEDGQRKLIVAFHNFVKAPNNYTPTYRL